MPRSFPRRRLLGGLAVATALAAAGCAGLVGPRTLTVSEADLQRRLAREFPVERRVLELFDLRLDSPRVALLPERNRVSVAFALSAVERLRERRREGQVSFETGLRWDAATQALRLHEVRVQALQLDGLSAAGSTGERLGRLLAEQWLEGQAVYTLRDQDRERLAGSGYAPSAVTVTSGGIELTLSPTR